MLAAWLMVLVAQAPVETSSIPAGLVGAGLVAGSSTAADPLLEDLPLTDEELALLESLEPIDTTSAGAPRSVALSGSLLVPPRRLQGRNGRSVGEALREEATAFSTSRRFITGESPISRGRGGQRVQLTMDGLELRHALDSVDRSTALGFIDPWVVGLVMIDAAPGLERGGFAGHGGLSLEGRSPPRSAGLTTELRGLGRLADRSSGFRAAASGGLGPAALSLAGGYSDHDPMRDGLGRQLPGTGDEESSLSSRARLFDRTRDPIELDVGFDLFRITNAKRFDLDERIDRLRSLASGFGRLRGGGGNTEFSLLVGARRFETSTEPRGGGPRSTDAADLMQASALVRHQFFERFAASVFADVYTSGAHGSIVRGRMVRASGGAAVEFGLGRFRGRAAVRSGYAVTDEDAGRTSEGAFVLPELRLGIDFMGPLTLLLGYQEAVHAPTVSDLSLARTSLEIEHTRTIELGLGYESELFGARAGAYTTIVQDPLELLAGELVNRPTLVMLGGEVEGSLRPLPGLELAAALGIVRGLGEERSSFIEGSSGAGRIRYEFGARNAYVELAVRQTLSFPGTSAGNDVHRRRNWPLPFVSLGGGLDLGLGFALGVQVANALDVDERELLGDIPRPGVDLRLAIDHRFEL